MEADLAESLEIVENFEKSETDINTDYQKFSKTLKKNKNLKKTKSKQLKLLKEKHGVSKKYNPKLTKIEKFDREKRIEANIKTLKSKDVAVDLERWCRLSGSKYLKQEKEEKEEEEETAFDDSFFEEFSKDFLP